METIRAEADGDADAIGALVATAFAVAPHASGTEAAIVTALREAGALELSLVALRAGRIVGHVAFSPVRIGGAPGGWRGLGPVAVAPDCQGQGIGSALVRTGLARLRDAGAAGCVVLGDPAWYGRFGFAPDPALRLPGAPPEYFLCLALAGSVPAGDVAYHAAFGAA